jgi:SAM-dependent methyltransferase
VSEYVGSELDLFQDALNWKRYWSSRVSPYLGKAVLEVGAGLGANVPFLISERQQEWLCIEPDPGLCARMTDKIRSGTLSSKCFAQVGTIDDVPPGRLFDAILYIDVIEHIDADTVEFHKAATRLTPGGHLIILSPAHQGLYSPFDAAIGHYRRYNRGTLGRLSEGTGLRQVRIFYLDSVGLAASFANKVLLKSAMPTAAQIQLWDRLMVRMSRIIDPLLLYSIGKTIVGVWQRS